MAPNHNHSHASPCNCCTSRNCPSLNRREFISSVSLAAGGLALGSFGAAVSLAGETEFKPVAPLPLKVQPVLCCQLFSPQPQTSWRPWGGFHNQEGIDQEKQLINNEMEQLSADAEFPLEILPLVCLNDVNQAAQLAQGPQDVMLVFAANSEPNVLEALTKPEKWNIIFVRHKSGPVYRWYEIIHNIYLRKTVDEFGQPRMDTQDVVVDKMDELLWRLRALYGLKNTLGKRIVALGGPSGWGAGGRNAPELSRKIWNLDIQTVDYSLLGEMINKARQNQSLLRRCTNDAQLYLKNNDITLETDKQFVINAFVLNEVFKDLLNQARTDAFTINNCMGTVMPIAQTTACVPLTLLNDSGYNAYCESDFVVIPSGILLHYISSKPVFLNDPTYPHDGVVTLAHCTAPRKMDGANYAPTRILTHFESDYGAAPKVQMELGRKITVIDPDFSSRRWLGFEGEIIDNPFLDICRSQIDVQINGDCELLNAETRGFHWMACYDNYLRELGYALKKVGIDWLNLSKPTLM